jgi:DNA-binding NarL/FixJ family response regulator
MTRQYPPRLSLLLIDASSAMRAQLRSALIRDPAFCLVGEAETAAVGLDLFYRFRPDVVLLGISLSDLSGFEVLAHIKQTAPRCSVILLSNSPDPFVEEVARQMGATEVWPRSGRFSLIREVLLGLVDGNQIPPPRSEPTGDSDARGASD